MEGKYNIQLNTPFGVEKGIFDLRVNGKDISGSIIARGKGNNFSGGEILGETIAFSGELKIVFMNIKYKATCKIINNKLTGIVSSKYGDFEVSGEKA